MGRYLEQIYGEIATITAKKTRDHRHCNYKCIQAGHYYRHKFKTEAKLQGVPDGWFLMSPEGQTILLSNGTMIISDREY